MTFAGQRTCRAVGFLVTGCCAGQASAVVSAVGFVSSAGTRVDGHRTESHVPPAIKVYLQ